MTAAQGGAPAPTPGPTAPPAAPGAPTPPDPPAYTPPATQEALNELIGKRLNQERAKYGGLSADEFAALRTKAEQFDAAEIERGTDMQKAVAKAAKDAQEAADAQYRPQLAETAFRVAIGDRKSADEVADFLGDLNLSRFITDGGQVDTAKVLARVEQFAPTKGAATQQSPTPAPRGPVVPGHPPVTAPASAPGDLARKYLAAKGITVA